MSDDLISRSAVINLIDELGYVNCQNGKDFEYNSRVDKIRQCVAELQTAYNVDKVVERIDNEIAGITNLQLLKIDEIVKGTEVNETT